MFCKTLALIALAAIAITAPTGALASVHTDEGVRGDTKGDWAEPTWMTNTTLLYAVFSDVANDPTVFSSDPTLGKLLGPSHKFIEKFDTPYMLEGVHKGQFKKKQQRFAALWDDDAKHLVIAFSSHPKGAVFNAAAAELAEPRFSDSVDYPFEDVTNAKVHNGFAGQYKKLRAATHRVIKDKDFIAKVTFTGHGIGGAHAQIAAVDVARKLKVPVEVVTFGAPRIGNAAFGAEYKRVVGNTLRVALIEQRCMDKGKKTLLQCQDPSADRPQKSVDFVHVSEAALFRYKTEAEKFSGKDFEDKMHDLESYEECVAQRASKSRRKAIKAANDAAKAKAKATGQQAVLLDEEAEIQEPSPMKPTPLPAMPTREEKKDGEEEGGKPAAAEDDDRAERPSERKKRLAEEKKAAEAKKEADEAEAARKAEEVAGDEL